MDDLQFDWIGSVASLHTNNIFSFYLRPAVHFRVSECSLVIMSRLNNLNINWMEYIFLIRPMLSGT